jgi:predicted transcriptional regulator
MEEENRGDSHMSMEKHTLRAVKITKNIFELRKINRDIEAVSAVMRSLEQRRTYLQEMI